MRTHDEAKVNVEEAAVRREHEIIVVSIAHAQDVGHHAVPRAALHKVVQHLRAQAEGSCMPRVSSKSQRSDCLPWCSAGYSVPPALSQHCHHIWNSWLMLGTQAQAGQQGPGQKERVHKHPELSAWVEVGVQHLMGQRCRVPSIGGWTCAQQ